MRRGSCAGHYRTRLTRGLLVRGLLAVLVVAMAVLHGPTAMATGCHGGSADALTLSQSIGARPAPAVTPRNDRMGSSSGTDVCCVATCVATPADCPGPEAPLALGVLGAEWLQAARVVDDPAFSGREPATPDLVSMLCVSRR